MQICDGWLNPCQHILSPNWNARPQGSDISLLVIHNISLPPLQFGGGYVEQFFCNQLNAKEHPYFATICDLQVSSHLLIDRLGMPIQFVSFLDRAWHAGASMFDGRANCNDFSIGIELEGSDFEPFTDAQYATLQLVTGVVLASYPDISLERIVGHSDIAPGRKTDPGPYFNWSRYRAGIKGEQGVG